MKPIHLKVLSIFSLFTLCCLSISGCSTPTIIDNALHKSQLESNLDIQLPKTDSISYSDPESSFHGDGLTSTQITISEASTSDFSNKLSCNEQWTELPLDNDIQLLLYGGHDGCVTYAYHFAQDAQIPQVENGYYYFHNDNPTDTNILSSAGGSKFTFAVYDNDSHILYYCRYRA
ncbi:MAG: hypothetical protein PHW47_05570 [Lachnospira sp.]|nr:hypothetical protein [Lachnospira sp.]